MNVLVYSEQTSGSTPYPDCLSSLRQILFPNYAVSRVTSDVLLNEPWTKACAMLVITGDDYEAVARRLGSPGTAAIQEFVRSGGSFLGINAGAYYGSSKCSITHGDNSGLKDIGEAMEQNLGFFPGECQGPYIQGHSTTNTAIVDLISKIERVGSLKAYHRDGGVFADAEKFASPVIDVLAEFAPDERDENGAAKAAAVYCTVGGGGCVLMSPHLELDPRVLPSEPGGSGRLLATLVQSDEARVGFLRGCLQKVGLDVNKDGGAIPSLTAIHLSSASRAHADKLMATLRDSMQEGVLVDEVDIFRFTESSTDLEYQHRSLEDTTRALVESSQAAHETVERPIKHIITHGRSHPQAEATPLFDHGVFFENLAQGDNTGRTGDVWFGNHLLYGEVMESTNTILASNHKFLNALPTGFTALASLQTAGRGRGSNVWVSPVGCLLFSTCIRHPSNSYEKSPVVFVQYIAAMAVVQAVRSYAPGYEDFPIHVKWPNDIYVKVSRDAEDQPQHAKIGGVLVQCSYIGGEFLLVAGVGVNTTNAAPTTSLRRVCNQLNARRVDAGLKVLETISCEKFLARILQAFERLYIDFRLHGWGENLDDKYINYWLHSGQIVTIESIRERPRGRIVGISHSSANLLVDELGKDGRPTGQSHELNPDGNSFDFFHGLLKTKE